MFDWSSPFDTNNEILQNVAVEIQSWGDPGKKRKQIENDDENRKRNSSMKKIVLTGNFPQNGKQCDFGWFLTRKKT